MYYEDIVDWPQHPRRAKQYSPEAESERARLARNLNSLYGFTPSELIKLTGTRLNESTLERLAA